LTPLRQLLAQLLVRLLLCPAEPAGPAAAPIPHNPLRPTLWPWPGAVVWVLADPLAGNAAYDGRAQVVSEAVAGCFRLQPLDPWPSDLIWARRGQLEPITIASACLLDRVL
jgi:hypothetical protein